MLLKISCLPRSTFYYHLKGNKTDKYATDKQAIAEVFNENEQRYGYRRITDELHAKGILINQQKGVKVNENAWYSRKKVQKRRVSFV